MSVYAIICEFNPFHNGHALLIDKIHEADPDAAVIAIMSGDFVQRGDVAVVDKYCRAEMALKCGCNLVLELPAPWSFSGAEFFACGGVGIADRLGIVDHLVFGSESGNIHSLIECACRLDSAEFAEKLSSIRCEHPEYNAAELRHRAYCDLYGKSSHFSGSNDLLALEYLSAINTLSSKITPVAVKRVGGDYNSAELSKICSATAIRQGILSGAELSWVMPKEAFCLLSEEIGAGRIYSFSRLDIAAAAFLRGTTAEYLSGIMEISGGMENRLLRAADTSRTIDEIVKKARQRRYSESRIRRAVIASLVGAKTADAERLPGFTVLLGADEVGRKLLSACRRKTDIAVISKPSDEKKLSCAVLEQYLLNKKAERIAELCCTSEPQRRRAVML